MESKNNCGAKGAAVNKSQTSGCLIENYAGVELEAVDEDFSLLEDEVSLFLFSALASLPSFFPSGFASDAFASAFASPFCPLRA